jgi:hypothetical protein
VTRQQVDAAYGPTFWLKTYLLIRMYESGAAVTWSRDRFKNKTKQVFEYYKVFDFETAIGYINDWAKKEMKLNLAKMLATDKSLGVSASDIQKAQDQYPQTGPSVNDIISGYQEPKEKPKETNIGKSTVFDPPLD